MSYSKQASARALALLRRYRTRDPFLLAEAMGITVLHGEKFGRLKGLYRVIKRNRFIILNADNDPHTDRIVCAHEIGHDQLHRALAQGRLMQETMLYDVSVTQEYEANLFAAELLLEDEELLEYAHQGYSAEQIASAMETDVNLVALKAICLNHRGYDLHRFPHSSDFLRQE